MAAVAMKVAEVAIPAISRTALTIAAGTTTAIAYFTTKKDAPDDSRDPPPKDSLESTYVDSDSKHGGTASPVAAAGSPGINGPGGGDDGDGGDGEEKDDKPIISKRDMKKLLESCGKEMHKKMTEKIKVMNQGKIWHDKNFRIDVCHPSKQNPKTRTWHLQVNNEAGLEMAKKYKSLPRNTHERLFEGRFDVENMPTYKEWENAILSRWK